MSRKFPTEVKEEGSSGGTGEGSREYKGKEETEGSPTH